MFQFTVLFSALIGLLFYAAYRFRWTVTGLLLAAVVYFPFLAASQEWEDWFRLSKTYSVLVPLFFFSLGQAVCSSRKDPRFLKYRERFSRRSQRRIETAEKKLLIGLIWAIPFVLILNLGEAVLQDFWAGEFLNALLGVALILTVPNCWGKWHFNLSGILGFGPYSDWCIVYTLWNAHFVQIYTEGLVQDVFPYMLILLISLLVCWACKDWHLWIFCRGFSLGFVLIAPVFFSFLSEQVVALLPATRWTLSEGGLALWSCLNLLAVAYIVYRTVKEKRNCLLYFKK